MKAKRKWSALTVVLAVLGFLTAVAIVLQVLMAQSATFSDNFNRTVGASTRLILGKLTGWIPFSLTEWLVLLSPLIVFLLVFWLVRNIKKHDGSWKKIPEFILCVLLIVYVLFVLTLNPGYHNTGLAERLVLKDEPVAASQLSETALKILRDMEPEIDSVTFTEEGASAMPYSFDELAEKLNQAYKKLNQQYPDLLVVFEMQPKAVWHSKPWTYTHIGGMYAFFTGESNLNVYFPDYHLPFTMAHEMAHQMGIGRENEANFVAFLACCASDDPYIRYSGFTNLYTYVANALYSASADEYWLVYDQVDKRVTEEFRSYSRFFEPFRETVVSKVSDAVNDAYLSAQGTPGVISYGLVVDLAVSYYADR